MLNHQAIIFAENHMEFFIIFKFFYNSRFIIASNYGKIVGACCIIKYTL